MNYHLVKTEPSTYSWDRLEKEKKCCWDGVRSYPGRLNLRNMKAGDLVLIYHSGDDKAVMGIAKVLREAYPDPTAGDEDWSAVDFAPVAKLKKPVLLSAIKSEKKLKDIYLIRQGRLSVMPLKKEEFELIKSLGSKD